MASVHKDKALVAVREVVPGTRRYTQYTVYELAESIRERDEMTYTHCRRVAIYAGRLARALGWTRREARDVALAGLVHDLGKTWIHNSILLKDGALSSAERSEMERHPAIAARILQAYDVPVALVDAVLYHHEAFDGRGYPQRLTGDAIPREARLLTVADVFDAMTTARSYKAPMPVEAARDRIAAGIGTHFDPHVAGTFIALLNCHPSFLVPSETLPSLFDSNSAWVRHDTF